MKLTKEQKDRLCDSKKKTSFSQRGSIELKSANTDKVFENLGISFSVAKDEIIESALFERTTRDCGGELLRKEPVRRFRKVGLDEWFSLDASMGNDYWSEIFTEATTDDSIEQYLINTNQKEKVKKEDNELPPISKIKTITKKEDKIAKTKEKPKSNVGLKILAVAVAAIAVYKIGIN
jgi:hypothetical protein